jgi:hypothetical protein
VILLLRYLLSLSVILMWSPAVPTHVFFVQMSAFEVPNVDTCCVWSAHWRIRVLWQLPTEIPPSDTIFSTDLLLSLLTVSRTCLAFASYVDDVWPLLGSSSTLMSFTEAFTLYPPV